MNEHKTSEAERLTKLALFVKEQQPVDFMQIRRGLYEYRFYEGSDKDAEKRHDQKIRRMFERDKKSLEECGIFVESDGYNRYVLNRSASYAAPVELTAGQASLLRTAISARLADESYPFHSELRMILAKIGDEFDVPDLLPGISERKPAHDAQLTGFGKVQKAIAARKRLRFEYCAANGRRSERVVEPFGCFFLKRRCYMVAFDPQASGDGVRSFRLDRMKHVGFDTSGSAAEFEPRSFDVGAWSGLPFQFGDQEFEALLSFNASCAWRAERICMGKGSFEEADDGLLWRVEARDAEALASWCVENGPGIRVLQPVRARVLFEDGVRGFLKEVR